MSRLGSRFLAAALALAGCASRSGTPSVQTAAEKRSPDISRERISAHIRFLADDLLEGRDTGARGYRIAAAYVAAELAKLGVAPGGDGGTYFQEVPLRAARVESASMDIAGRRLELQWKRDFLASAELVRGELDVEAPLVFLGYAVKWDDYRYDDLSAREVKGKIAVFVDGAPLGRRPDFFPDIASGVASDRLVKIDALADRGAVGIIVVRAPRQEKAYGWDVVVQGAQFEAMGRVDGKGMSRGLKLPRFTVPSATMDRILQAAGRTERIEQLVAAAEAGKPETFEVGISARLRIRSPVRELSSPNVIGVWPGDSARDEAVVVSAHLDHMGMGPEVAGDKIYNGAGDDAAGCAAVLEIARAFATREKRPRRSIVFAFFTAEERGLHGSENLAQHPPAGLPAPVAVIQTDMATYPIFPLRDIEPLGAEHSTLEADVRAAAEAMGISLSPDALPDQTRFIRSDHYSFVRQGVPAVYPMVGMRGTTPQQRAAIVAFVRERYHQPQDEWEPRRDYQPLADLARFQFLVAQSIAERPERPRWKPGDFFERFTKR